MQIKGSIAIVTGGASGIGAATAKHLSALGATVAIFDREIGSLKSSTTGLAIHCDITDEKSIVTALQQTTEQLGTARICINCAGIVGAERLVGKKGIASLEHFRKIIDVNLIGTFNMMRLVAANMISLNALTDTNERGVIINTASIAAFEGQMGQTAYSASKAGIVGLTLPAARDLSEYGIRVVTIAPGPMDTPLLSGIPAHVRQALIDATPFPKRLGKADEYAKLAAHIIDNPLINGEVIRLDGALRLPFC